MFVIYWESAKLTNRKLILYPLLVRSSAQIAWARARICNRHRHTLAPICIWTAIYTHANRTDIFFRFRHLNWCVLFLSPLLLLQNWCWCCFDGCYGFSTGDRKEIKKRSNFRLCCVYALDLIYREINRSVVAWSVDCIDGANVAAIQFELRPMYMCWCVCAECDFFYQY